MTFIHSCINCQLLTSFNSILIIIIIIIGHIFMCHICLEVQRRSSALQMSDQRVFHFPCQVVVTVVTSFKHRQILFFFGVEESCTKQRRGLCAAVGAPARVSNSFTPVWKNKSAFYSCCSSVSFSSRVLHPCQLSSVQVS